MYQSKTSNKMYLYPFERHTGTCITFKIIVHSSSGFMDKQNERPTFNDHIEVVVDFICMVVRE